jgi:hypothetical protein
MTSPSRLIAAALAACAASAALLPINAGAQTIYRCGNEYTRIPCADGRALETGDTRSAAQRAEARRQIADERRLGNEMEKERRRNEAAIKPAAAGSLNASSNAASGVTTAKKPATKSKRPKAKAKPADDADFVAGVPGSGQKKR